MADPVSNFSRSPPRHSEHVKKFKFRQLISSFYHFNLAG